MEFSGRLAVDSRIADWLDCSDRELEAKFLGLLSEIQKRYHEYGIFLTSPSQQAVAQFLSLPYDSQSEALAQLRMMYLISVDPDLPAPVVAAGETATPHRQFGLREEIHSIKSFLWRSGLRVSDDEIFDRVRDGDVIEIYNIEHRQVYRSWSFFRLCSYSLADVLVFEWNKLYARPAWVISRIFADLCDLIEGRKKSVKVDVPEFLISEKFSVAEGHFLMKMRHACAVIDQVTGQTRGYLTSQRVRRVQTSEVSDKISFI